MMLKKKLAMLCSVSMLLALPGCCGWKFGCKKKCDDRYEDEDYDRGERKHKKTTYEKRERNGGRRMKTETSEEKY